MRGSSDLWLASVATLDNVVENPPGLQRLGSEESLGQYLSDIWERREFAVVVPANDLRAQNMDTALGQLWHILNPAALIAIYWLIFGVLLGVDGQPRWQLNDVGNTHAAKNLPKLFSHRTGGLHKCEIMCRGVPQIEVKAALQLQRRSGSELYLICRVDNDEEQSVR